MFEFLSALGGGLGLYLGFATITVCELIVVALSALAANRKRRNEERVKQLVQGLAIAVSAPAGIQLKADE
jgi:hypothetical protein